MSIKTMAPEHREQICSHHRTRTSHFFETGQSGTHKTAWDIRRTLLPSYMLQQKDYTFVSPRFAQEQSYNNHLYNRIVQILWGTVRFGFYILLLYVPFLVQNVLLKPRWCIRLPHRVALRSKPLLLMARKQRSLPSSKCRQKNTRRALSKQPCVPQNRHNRQKRYTVRPLW